MNPGDRIHQYDLVRLLGRGGMGDVWLASDVRADRSVALKLIRAGLLEDPAVRTRFLNEARTLGRLEHDRIVTLYAVAEEGGSLALVLRFIDGASLADRIDKQGALPLDFVLASARDILPALGFAHQQGIIHRDIKPQNVLVDKRDRSFLTDFGIAVGDFAERGTVTGFAVGTPHYMSPEQIQTPRAITIQNGGNRSDIYSYGVVLYEMLTGRVPFCSESGVDEIFAIQSAHCMQAPQALREVNPEVPAAIEEVVLRCLAKNPADRPRTCEDLLDEFSLAAGVTASGKVRSSSYAPTIVEKPRASLEQTPKIAPPPAAAKPSRNAAVRKLGWLGAGATLIIAGVSFAIISSNHQSTPSKPIDKSAAPQADKTNSSGRTNPPAPDPNLTRKTNNTGSDTGHAPIARTGYSSKPPIQSPAISGAPNLAAEKYYDQAVDLLKKGSADGAKSALDSALRLDPSNPKYQVLNRQIQDSITTLTQAADFDKQAHTTFNEGDNCEAKNFEDQAVSRAPRNPTYLSFQQTLKKACELAQ